MQTLQFQVSERIYQQVQKRALAMGFIDVEAYVVDVLANDLGLEEDHLDHLFTPEVISQIEAADARTQKGEVTSFAEALASTAEFKAHWHSISLTLTQYSALDR